MRKIGIISRCDRDEIVSLVEKIVNRLKSRVEVLIDRENCTKAAFGRHPNGRYEEKWPLSLSYLSAAMYCFYGGIQKMDDPFRSLG